MVKKELEAKTRRNVVSPLSAKRFFEAQKQSKSLDNKNENDNSNEK